MCSIISYWGNKIKMTMIYHVISTRMATFFKKVTRYIEWNVIQQEKNKMLTHITIWMNLKTLC